MVNLHHRDRTNIAGWKMDPLKMDFLLAIGIFHCHAGLPEGKFSPKCSCIFL